MNNHTNKLQHRKYHSDVEVCDTEYYAHSTGFAAFRDAISGAFMPWAIEFTDDSEFSARMVSLTTNSGAVARVRMNPVTAVRKSIEVASSATDCFYANYILSGELTVEQNGRVALAECGDIVIYDSSCPVKITERSSGTYEDLAFRIPKTRLTHVQNAEELFNNIVIPADRLISPLGSCLTFLSHNLLTASADELGVFHDMCATLLPVAAGFLANKEDISNEATIAPNHYMRELLHYIHANIGHTELSPQRAADQLGISVRYVHKQFALRGTTFTSYVMAKRLEFVRRDLISKASRDVPICSLAYRWGFNDLSTFIRAFKKKFGCSPRQYRLKF